MKISYQWLQSYIEEPLPEPDALAEAIIFGAFEVENAEALETLQNGDVMLDIKTLPDRNHDALGHYGMAREVAGLLGLHLKPLAFRAHTSVPGDVRVSIRTQACRRYVARKIIDVTVRPSPQWLALRLEAIGQRSVNNVVDATNYVMYALGQPIHAFDYDKLGSERDAGHMVVRQAYDGEEMLTLDGKLVPLDGTVAVVTNEKLDQPLAVAGVKGGKAAEVDAGTRNIVVEVANFDPVSVRRTARKLGIQTDSSKRFENGLSAHVAGIAIHMITDLITEVADGQPEDPVDEYPDPERERTLSFTAAYVSDMLGTDVSVSEIRGILDRYSYAYTEHGGTFDLAVPSERLDITGSHDMVEEIGRVYGYGTIQARLPRIDFVPAVSERFAKLSAIRGDLVRKGYREVQTYAFRKKGDLEVARGPAGKSALRTNLVDGLGESLALNRQNAALLGMDDVRIFEIGTVFRKDGEEMLVGTADASGVTETTLDAYVSKNNLPVDGYGLLPSEAPLETAGTLSEAVAVSGSFKPWSEYPYMTRDIAVWIPESDDAPDLVSIITNNATALLHCEPRLFDQFTKDGRTSFGYRMVFQSYERTLTDEEVNAIMETINGEVAARGWEVR